MFTERCPSLNVRSFFAFDKDLSIPNKPFVRSSYYFPLLTKPFVRSSELVWVIERQERDRRGPDRDGLETHKEMGPKITVEADGPVRVPDFHSS